MSMFKELFKKVIKEASAPAPTKPTTKPGVKPGEKPGAPFPRPPGTPEPGKKVRPKALAEDEQSKDVQLFHKVRSRKQKQAE